MSNPRIFVLAREGWEETLEHYERRNGEPLDSRHRDHASEVAPGVRVALLATGDMMTMDGQRVRHGARVAVWRDDGLTEALAEYRTNHDPDSPTGDQ